jgi:hypothetical protein
MTRKPITIQKSVFHMIPFPSTLGAPTKGIWVHKHTTD